jgi:exoribonuclease-2
MTEPTSDPALSTMSQRSLSPGSLVLYKIRPARVVAVSDKIDIEIEGGKIKRVRPKDIVPLHPGPVADLSHLTAPTANLQETLELLEGAETNLQELAELLYGDFTPVTAWGAWELLADGLYFEGTPDRIIPRNAEQVAADRAAREARETEKREWAEFLERLREGRLWDRDRERLQEVERLACGESEQSRILQALEIQEKPENAYRLLARIGYWEPGYNPYPRRLSLPQTDPELAVPGLPVEERLDLAHLTAYAIDDDQTHDPDDALSLEGDRIWVHVADVAALIPPDSDVDRAARVRGANLYLPERIVHMLPPAVTEELGLGLQETSPALSIGFRLDAEGRPVDTEICLSRIRVTRRSYEEIDETIQQEPFARLAQLTERYRSRRQAAGAAGIDLPEVSVRVRDGAVVIRPLARTPSRQLVADAMTMAGEVVARYAREHGIPIPYATQPPPANPQVPQGLAAMYAYRRQLQPSQSRIDPEPHAGLGLELYTRATSPLRRYLDLVVHQQLRSHLRGLPLLSSEQVAERIVAAEIGSKQVRRAERLSNSHWKMVYLRQNSGWKGNGVVVELAEQRATVLIPELALETRLRLDGEVPLDSELPLRVREVDVPALTAWFQIQK